MTAGFDVVTVGTSWGGLKALRTFVSGLPTTFAPAVILVQHRSRESEALRELLQECAALPVVEVEDKQPITGGSVYLAPPDYHLLVDGDHFSLTTDAPVRFSRPSIDVVLESVADSYGARAIGVIMTGANDDGALGLWRIAKRGGYTIVQDPQTAESPLMPSAAKAAVPSARVLRLEEIAPHLVSLVATTPRRRAEQPA